MWIPPKIDWEDHDGVMAGDFNRMENNTETINNSYVIGGRLRSGFNNPWGYIADTMFLIDGIAVFIYPGQRLVRTRSQQTMLIRGTPLCNYYIHSFVGPDMNFYFHDGLGNPVTANKNSLPDGNDVVLISDSSEGVIDNEVEIASIPIESSIDRKWCSVYVGIHIPTAITVSQWDSEITARRYAMSLFLQVEQI